jgi:eukaryotic-like serine/threonine-protein kinase
MTPQHRSRIKEILDVALSLEEPARTSYLDAECAENEELGGALRDILQGEGPAEGFLEDAVSISLPYPPPEEIPAEFRGTRRFEILRPLGRGGFGDVYEVLDHSLGIRVALKVLRNCHPDLLSGFKRGARALDLFSHPNVCIMHELIFDHEAKAWLTTMELIPGAHLTDYLERHPTQVRDVFCQLAEALKALHRAQVTHCDVKPSNVLVTNQGFVKLLDFGLTERRQEAMLAKRAVIAATPDYAAPEIFANRPSTAASDWYSVGVMLYQVLCGRLPFSGSPRDVIDAKQATDCPPTTNIAPGLEDLADLATRLLHRDPESRPGPDAILQVLAPLAPPSSTSPEGTFVGREEQIRLLESVFRQKVQQGRGATAHISGASGIGKTALIQKFLRGLPPGVSVFTGKCYQGESLPYKALDELVTRIKEFLQVLPLKDAASVLPLNFGLLVRVFPALEVLLPAASLDLEQTSDQHQLRQRAFEAFRQLLVNLAKQAPVVIFLDDLQWGDLDSALLLQHLTYGEGAPPMLLLLAYRDGPAGESLAALRDKQSGDFLEIVLGPLGVLQSRALAESLLDERHAGAAAKVSEESGGSPFFLRQLATHAQKGGSFGTFEELIHQRATALPEAEQRFLEVLAIARAPLSLCVLRDAADLGEQLLMVKAALLNESLIRSPGDSPSTCDAYHERIAEAIAKEIPEPRRIQIHQRLAASLEANHEPDAERTARHYLNAGCIPDACRLGRAAAEHAVAVLAFDRAAQLFRNVIDWSAPRQIFTPAEVSELERAHGDALVNCGRGVEGARAFERATKGASPLEQVRLRIRFASELLKSGEVGEGLSALRRLLAEFNLPFPETRSLAIGRFLWEKTKLGLRRLTPRAGNAAGPGEFDSVRLDICWAAAIGTGMVYPLMTEIYCAIYLRLALNTIDPKKLAIAWASYASRLAYIDDGKLEQARALMLRAEHFARTDGGHYAAAFVSQMWATLEMLGGNWRKSYTHACESRRIFEERCVGVAWELATAKSFLFTARTLTGDWAANAREIPELIREAHDRGDRYAEVTLRLVTGFYSSYFIDDQPDEAEAVIRQCLAAWPRGEFDVQQLYAFQGSVDLDLYRGRVDRAWQRVRQTWPDLERSGLLRITLMWTFSEAARGRAAIALAASEHSSADERRQLLKIADRAAKRLISCKARYAPGLGWMLSAGAATLREDRPAAREHLARAESALAACDLLPWLATAQLGLAALIGGEAGEQKRQAGLAWMKSQQIRRPECIVRMLFPSA